MKRHHFWGAATALVLATTLLGGGSASASAPPADLCSVGPPAGSPAGDHLRSPQVVYVNWDGEVFPLLDQILPTFYQDITNPNLSSYLSDIAFNYRLDPGSPGAGVGSYLGEYTLIPQNTPFGPCSPSKHCSLQESEVIDEMRAAIGRDNLPTSSVLYMIQLPPNTDLFDSTGAGRCAFHDAFHMPVEGVDIGTLVPFGVMGDWGPGSQCNQPPDTETSHLNDATLVASHELIEAYVDPFGSDYEIGDPCQCPTRAVGGVAWETFQGSTHTWFVQQPWLFGSASFGIPDGCSASSNTPQPSAANSSGFAVARSPNNLDEFWESAAGTLSTAFWPQGTPWGNMNIYTNGPIVAGGAIAATARTSNNIDIFYIGNDGALWTSAWSPSGGWGTRAISITKFAPPGAPITAVTRGANLLDVFVVDNGGSLQRANWNGSTWSITFAGASAIAPGASVAAVARTTNNLDVFFVGLDGGIWTTFLGENLTSFGRTEIPNTAGTALSNVSIAATARSWINLDAFYTDINGKLVDVSWKPEAGYQLQSTGSSPGASATLAAVTRDPDTLDIFAIDAQGVENMWLHNGTTWGKTNTGFGAGFVPGSGIAAIARTPNNLDVFDFFLVFPVTQWWSTGHAWGQTFDN